MPDPETQRERFQEINQLTTRLRSVVAPEERSAEALIEIVEQLMKLNHSVEDLTDAVQAVADAS
ncbi:MAG: hypothetical protein WA837_18740 [Xanthobacteraceae bacterium]